MIEFWLLLAFVVKHFVCDYILQRNPYQYLNKGTYGHPGGLLHAWIHGVGTWFVLALLLPPGPFAFFVCVALALADSVVHYHIDWAKVNVCRRYNWKPDNSDNYWCVLGLDQLLHYLTYFTIVAVIV